MALANASLVVPDEQRRVVAGDLLSAILLPDAPLMMPGIPTND